MSINQVGQGESKQNKLVIHIFFDQTSAGSNWNTFPLTSELKTAAPRWKED